jgi:pimeloyl-ACP methyl ester carboxylesterase
MSNATVLRTADGVRLATRWWAPPETADAPDHNGISANGRRGVAAVLVHGFGGSKDDPGSCLIAAHLADHGHTVLTYDSRGHGESEGRCTLGDLERLDVDAAVGAAGAIADHVVLIGTSMGGVAVLNHVASGTSACGAVVVATPALWQLPRSWRGVLSAVATQTGLGRVALARWNGTRLAVRPTRGLPPATQIRNAHLPLAVIHGRDDRFLPADAARLLFAAAPAPKWIDLVPGMGHGLCARSLDPIGAAVDRVLDAATEGTTR